MQVAQSLSTLSNRRKKAHCEVGDAYCDLVDFGLASRSRWPYDGWQFSLLPTVFSEVDRNKGEATLQHALVLQASHMQATNGLCQDRRKKDWKEYRKFVQ